MKKYFKITFLLLLIFQFSCTKLVFQPTRHLYYSPEETLKIAPESYDIEVAKGIKLHAWKFKSQTKETKGVVVQFHGNAQNISSHYVSIVWMINEGYDVFTFDYRGYGLSEGSPKFPEVIEDGKKVLSFVKNLYADQKVPIIVYGQSLGSLIAANVIQDKNIHVDQLIIEGGIYSLNQVSADILSKHWITWLFQPLGYVLISSKYNVKNFYKDFPKIPTLLLHSKNDPIISYQQSEKIYRVLPGPKCLELVDEETHIGIGNLSKGKYRRDILNFLEKGECSSANAPNTPKN